MTKPKTFAVELTAADYHRIISALEDNDDRDPFVTTLIDKLFLAYHNAVEREQL